MKNPLEHPAIKWILTIVVFIASFHATWTALKYINPPPRPIPSFDYGTREPELPPQESPEVLIEDPPQKSPGVLIEDRSQRSIRTRIHQHLVFFQN
jgi:hypothetical protein